MDITVRRATEHDASIISALNRTVQAKHVSALPWLFKNVDLDEAAITSLLGDKETILLLACTDISTVGYVYAQVRTFSETPLTNAYSVAHVHHISVIQPAQKRGVGRAMLEAVKAMAKERGIGRMSADVWSFNSDAASFFENSDLVPYMVRRWRQIDG